MKQTIMKAEPRKLSDAQTCAAASRASCSLELRDELTMAILIGVSALSLDPVKSLVLGKGNRLGLGVWA